MKSERQYKKDFMDRISYENLILHYRWIKQEREKILKNA